MDGLYNDKEKISYEGIVTSLKTLVNHVGDGSELVSELQKLDQACDKLVTVWNSDASLRAKASITDIKGELEKVKINLNTLIGEITTYNERANAINDGTR